MELIYNQRNIPREQWRYGFRSSAATGCGWISVYNALALLGYRVEPEKLIRYFERQLPLIHGNAGTSVPGPAICFRQWGFPVKMAWKRTQFDALARESDVCILFYHWRRDWKLGAHFITLQAGEQGFTGYNVYRNSTGPENLGESVEAFLERRKYFGPVLIGIRDKRK